MTAAFCIAHKPVVEHEVSPFPADAGCVSESVMF